VIVSTAENWPPYGKHKQERVFDLKDTDNRGVFTAFKRSKLNKVTQIYLI